MFASGAESPTCGRARRGVAGRTARDNSFAFCRDVLQTMPRTLRVRIAQTWKYSCEVADKCVMEPAPKGGTAGASVPVSDIEMLIRF